MSGGDGFLSPPFSLFFSVLSNLNGASGNSRRKKQSWRSHYEQSCSFFKPWSFLSTLLVMLHLYFLKAKKKTRSLKTAYQKRRPSLTQCAYVPVFKNIYACRCIYKLVGAPFFWAQVDRQTVHLHVGLGEIPIELTLFFHHLYKLVHTCGLLWRLVSSAVRSAQKSSPTFASSLLSGV